ncbi:undecaprenyl diphosphate synthase [Ruminococcaceae bacterium YRB3002]|nr:undecaprenyl diphosphate synthase [Ruminococcaceae bacterium YRB3002]
MGNKEDRFNRPDLKIPVSLGVIMDGNGRWAKKRHLPRSAGHKAGGDSLYELCKNCGYYGVKYLTVYAFSTENWSRPEAEISALMKLFVESFDKYDPELEKYGIRLRFSGDISAMPENIQKVCRRAEERSAGRTNLQLIIALNYGGRREIATAARKLAESCVKGDIKPEDITEEMMSSNMYLPDVPDPDLIIRPSGEMRISNFLLWECAYSELWVSDVLWPDFGFDELTRAFEDYTKRDRRFGGLSKVDSDSPEDSK